MGSAAPRPRLRLLAAIGALVAVCAFPAAAQATFPGANGRIAYEWSRGGDGFETPPHPRYVGIFSVRPDGSDRRLVARGAGLPGYSPDGRRIAFLRGGRVWVARADGRHARRLTPARWSVESFSWSRGGNRLAFVRQLRGVPGQWLYAVERDGSDLKRLSKAPSGMDLPSDAWSRDGRAVVYTEQRNTARSFVQVVRAGKVSRLAVGFGAHWSRRGTIAYEARVDGGGNRGQTCVTRPGLPAPLHCFVYPGATVFGPQWFPDGGRLLLGYSPELAPSERWIARPDGTVLTRIAAGDGSASATVSPNGGRLAFSRQRFGGEPRLGYSDLFVSRPDGTARRLLVRGGQAARPDWQPRPRR